MKDSDRLAPTTRFECGSPRITAIQCPQMRDFCVPAECVRQTCGMAISPAEVSALTLSVWSAQRAENGLCRSRVNRGFERNGLWLLKNPLF